jgi:IrrE N-terminal-like domain
MSIFKPYRFYSKSAIEYQASHLLRRMQGRGCQFAPSWPFDATLVADFLDLGVVWERIPPDELGAIAARILPQQRLIEINEDILDLPQGFQESTLAHEIGHWVLHINQEVADGITSPTEEQKTDNLNRNEPFFCRGKGSSRELDSIEWQAQYFAGCLLMPRHILLAKAQQRDLTLWPHLYELKDELGVSISNLVNRLQDLGWIYVLKGSRQIYPGQAAIDGDVPLFG